MIVREYRRSDAEATQRVFTRSIFGTASADYSPRQIAAWSGAAGDLASWGAERARAGTFVALVMDSLAGFADVDRRGHIDMLYVDPAFARRGVASALLARIEEVTEARGVRELTAHVSISARRFFEHHGFVMVEKRHPVRDGVEFVNFRMHRELAPSTTFEEPPAS